VIENGGSYQTPSVEREKMSSKKAAKADVIFRKEGKDALALRDAVKAKILAEVRATGVLNNAGPVRLTLWDDHYINSWGFVISYNLQDQGATESEHTAAAKQLADTVRVVVTRLVKEETQNKGSYRDVKIECNAETREIHR